MLKSLESIRHGTPSKSKELIQCCINDLVIFNQRSDLCTGAIHQDFSDWVNGVWQTTYNKLGEFGTPCFGDWGTSLMTDEKNEKNEQR